MDIRELRCAVAVADEGSFSGAARYLLITRQAVTKTVRAIESQVGFRLFEQAGQSLALTERGMQFIEAARRTVRCFDEELGPFLLVPDFPFNSPDQAIRRPLTVALVSGGTVGLPPRFFERFTSPEAGIALAVEEMSSDSVLDAVECGNVDVGILGTHPSLVRGFETRAIRLAGIWLIVPECHAFYRYDHVELADLDGQPMVTAGHHNHLHRYFMDRCRAEGVEPDIRANTTDGAMMAQLAREYGALRFGFNPSVAPQAKGERAIELLIPGGDAFGTYALRRPSSRPTEGARLFWALA